MLMAPNYFFKVTQIYSNLEELVIVYSSKTNNSVLPGFKPYSSGLRALDTKLRHSLANPSIKV